MRFETNDGEKIFGMGQYQQPYLDLKGCVLEPALESAQIDPIPVFVRDGRLEELREEREKGEKNG